MAIIYSNLLYICKLFTELLLQSDCIFRAYLRHCIDCIIGLESRFLHLAIDEPFIPSVLKERFYLQSDLPSTAVEVPPMLACEVTNCGSIANSNQDSYFIMLIDCCKQK